MLASLLEQVGSGDLGWYRQPPDVLAVCEAPQSCSVVPLGAPSALPVASFEMPGAASALIATAVAFVSVQPTWQPPAQTTPIAAAVEAIASSAYVRVPVAATPTVIVATDALLERPSLVVSDAGRSPYPPTPIRAWDQIADVVVPLPNVYSDIGEPIYPPTPTRPWTQVPDLIVTLFSVLYSDTANPSTTPVPIRAWDQLADLIVPLPNVYSDLGTPLYPPTPTRPWPQLADVIVLLPAVLYSDAANPTTTPVPTRAWDQIADVVVPLPNVYSDAGKPTYPPTPIRPWNPGPDLIVHLPLTLYSDTAAQTLPPTPTRAWDQIADLIVPLPNVYSDLARPTFTPTPARAWIQNADVVGRLDYAESLFAIPCPPVVVIFAYDQPQLPTLELCIQPSAAGVLAVVGLAWHPVVVPECPLWVAEPIDTHARRVIATVTPWVTVSMPAELSPREFYNGDFEAAQHQEGPEWFPRVQDTLIEPLIWTPPTHIVIVRRPAKPKPKPTPSVGRGGGGGGGGWRRWEDDDPIWDEPIYDPDGDYVRVSDEIPPLPPLSEPRGATTSIPTTGVPTLADLAELLGPGFAGYQASKIAGKVAGKSLGKHGKAAASVASLFVMGKATSKLQTKYGVPLVLGSALGALDDLVDVYVGKPDEGPTVTLATAAEFVEQAKRAQAEVWISRRTGTSKSTGKRAVVLRYTFTTGEPKVSWAYQEVVLEGAYGKFNVDGTLYAMMRKRFSSTML